MENMTPAERERHRLAESLVEDYLMEWCESHSKKVSATTANIYSHVDASSTFQCAMTIDEVLGKGK